jgi:CheY-like chemotaxis protein
MRTILVVDDETPLVELLQAILEDQGYQVVVASNGYEALAVLARQPVDVVLSDVMMPVFDGVRLCQAMQQHPAYRAIPVILASAVGPPKLAADCRWAAFLSKPFDYDLLLATVARLLDSSG